MKTCSKCDGFGMIKHPAWIAVDKMATRVYGANWESEITIEQLRQLFRSFGGWDFFPAEFEGCPVCQGTGKIDGEAK